MNASEWNASKLRSWHRCPRRFKHEHIDGLGAGTSDNADFGTVFHNRCENRLLAAMNATPVLVATLADPYEQARLDALWVGYEARWNDAGWRVLGAEVPFRYELGGITLTSHKGMDGLVQNIEDGRIYVLEHKTTGSDASAGASYWERLALDAQVSIYIDAATALGYDVAGVIYDVVARPRHERKLATPEADRTLTQGKGCKVCGGKAKGVKGSGKRLKVGEGGCVCLLDDDRCVACACPACNGLGWEEAPRLHANQRDRDETPDEFFDRIVSDIASRPDDYYTRQTITRTEAQMDRARASILDTVKLARLAEVVDAFPMNDSACFAYNTKCFAFDACSGAADINDRLRFPLRSQP